jgi:hypothetical protein
MWARWTCAGRSATKTSTSATCQRLLDRMSDVPAVVLGRRMDVLAYNALAGALLCDSRRARIPTTRS